MTLLEIYESAQIERPPPQAFGGEVRVRNRNQMLAALTKHRRMQELYIAVAFLVVVAIFGASLYFAVQGAAQASQVKLPASLPYLGSGIFALLLAFLRWLLQIHNEGGLLDAALRFASDEQLATFVEMRLAVKHSSALELAPNHGNRPRSPKQ